MRDLGRDEQTGLAGWGGMIWKEKRSVGDPARKTEVDLEPYPAGSPMQVPENAWSSQEMGGMLVRWEAHSSHPRTQDDDMSEGLCQELRCNLGTEREGFPRGFPNWLAFGFSPAFKTDPSLSPKGRISVMSLWRPHHHAQTNDRCFSGKHE